MWGYEMTDMGAQLSNDYIHRKMTMSEHFTGKCNLQQEIHLQFHLPLRLKLFKNFELFFSRFSFLVFFLWVGSLDMKNIADYCSADSGTFDLTHDTDRRCLLLPANLKICTQFCTLSAQSGWPGEVKYFYSCPSPPIQVRLAGWGEVWELYSQMEIQFNHLQPAVLWLIFKYLVFHC